MLSPTRSAPVLVLVALLLAAGCREVSQPALEGPRASGTLFPVETTDGWGYITREGRLAISPRFDRAYRFVGNRALIRQDGKYGFIDTSGTVVIPPEFAAAGSFADGRAPVRPDSLWGFVDPSGVMVVDPQFRFAPRGGGSGQMGTGPAPSDSVAGRPQLVVPAPDVPTYFPGGRARIRSGDRWGYVDRTGATVIAPRFARAHDFREGLARVRFPDGQMGYVARDGSVVWPPRNDENGIELE